MTRCLDIHLKEVGTVVLVLSPVLMDDESSMGIRFWEALLLFVGVVVVNEVVVVTSLSVVTTRWAGECILL